MGVGMPSPGMIEGSPATLREKQSLSDYILAINSASRGVKPTYQNESLVNQTMGGHGQTYDANSWMLGSGIYQQEYGKWDTTPVPIANEIYDNPANWYPGTYGTQVKGIVRKDPLPQPRDLLPDLMAQLDELIPQFATLKSANLAQEASIGTLTNSVQTLTASNTELTASAAAAAKLAKQQAARGTGGALTMFEDNNGPKPAQISPTAPAQPRSMGGGAKYGVAAPAVPGNLTL